MSLIKLEDVLHRIYSEPNTSDKLYQDINSLPQYNPEEVLIEMIEEYKGIDGIYHEVCDALEEALSRIIINNHLKDMNFHEILSQEIVEKDLKENKKDARGFRIFTEFKDTYNSNVTVKQSSSVEKRAWIFVEGDGITGINDGAIHLDERQAFNLIAALDIFLKSN